MPVKLRKVMKRDVVTVKEGRRLGRPEDLRIDPREHRVAILVLARGSVPDSSLVVHASAVRSFEADRLAIDDLDALKVAARDETALRLLEQGLHLQGREVMSATGHELGRIASVLVDSDGRVTEYRLRKGLRGWLWPAVKVTPDQIGTTGGEIAIAEREESRDAAPTPTRSEDPS